MSRLLPLLFCLSLVAGCGQSGDLYLPGNAPERSDVLAGSGDDEDEGGTADEDAEGDDDNG